ncbi:DUF4013 domain-containing protein [Methanocaldococcus sp.]
MVEIGKYVSDAYHYAISDIKKGLVGALLSSIAGAFGAIFGTLLSLYIISYLNPETSPMSLISVILIACVGFLIALIIGFILDGYYVRVMKTSVENSNTLPDWNNVKDLLVRGFLYWVGGLIVGIIFLIIPFLLIVFGMFLMFIPPLGLLVAGIGFICLIISMIAYIFYSGLAEVNYSVIGFSGFFEFKKIFKMMNIDYILLVIVVIILTILVILIVNVPFMIFKLIFAASSMSKLTILLDIISTVVSSFVGFFTAVFCKRAIALFYRDRIKEIDQY